MVCYIINFNIKLIMTTINNNIYTFSVKRDKYILVNKKTTILEYILHLYTKEDTVDTIVSSGSILASNNIDYVDIEFALISDGKYKLEIIDADDIYFESWINLRNQLIPLIKKVLCCSCGCKGSCDTCLTKEAKDCIRNQSLFNMITTYQYLIKPFSIDTWLATNEDLFNFYQKTFFDNREASICLLAKQIYDNSLYGTPTTNNELFKYNIAIYYLGLYIYAKSDTLEEDMVYLNDIYQYNTINKCIAKLGINIGAIEGEYNQIESLVYYWQLNNTDDDINDIVPIFNTTYLEDKPVTTLGVFEEGKIINYILIGRIAFAVTNTTGIDFIILDSLGNDVTDSFDSSYFPDTSTILLVSKVVQSYSNIYFKFKSL